MPKIPVSIVKYAKPLESVRKAVGLCSGLDYLPSKARVFIKPNPAFFQQDDHVFHHPGGGDDAIFGKVCSPRPEHDIGFDKDPGL